jgi:hypothetical protein
MKVASKYITREHLPQVSDGDEIARQSQVLTGDRSLDR